MGELAARSRPAKKQRWQNVNTATSNAAKSMNMGVASTGGVTLLPLYAQNLLSPSVVIRPLQGEAPTIDLVIGYSKANTSPLLKRFLSRADELVARVTKLP